MNQKGFSNIVLVVIIIVLVGVAGYFTFVKKLGPLAQQPAPKDEIIGWETYNNNSLGFSIKYPSDAKPSIELNDQDKLNRLTGFGKSTDKSSGKLLPGKYKYFEVRLEEDTDPDVGIKYGGFLDSKLVSKDIKLDGVSGYKAVETVGYDGGDPFVEFGARHNGDIYHIIFYGDVNVSEEEQQILSSFKFTK